MSMLIQLNIKVRGLFESFTTKGVSRLKAVAVCMMLWQVSSLNAQEIIPPSNGQLRTSTATNVSPQVETWQMFTSFFTSPTGATIAWFATLIGLLAAIIPLSQLASQRREARLLKEVLEQFHLKETLKKETEAVTASKADIESNLAKRQTELDALTLEISEKIPKQARAAFYATAIPEIEAQILALSEQREIMNTALSKLNVAPVDNQKIKRILDEEISSSIRARRSLEEKQTMLSIVSGFAAASSFLGIFGPVGLLFTVVLAFWVLFVSHQLGLQWSLVYPEARLAKLLRSRAYRFVPLFLGIAVGALLVMVLYFAIIRHDWPLYW